MRPGMRMVRGIVASAQEGRFMLAAEDGRMRLMVLAPDAGIEPQDLPGFVRRGRVVAVGYRRADGRHVGIVHRLHEI